MDAARKDPDVTPVEITEEEAIRPWRMTTFVVWRGKLQPSLCLAARQIPTVSPLVVWRMYEPEARSAGLVPRRRRLSC